MKKLFLFMFLFMCIFLDLFCADFEESIKRLMPLEQLESKIKSTANEASINDWDHRFDRFKKHIEVLKSADEFKSVMDEVKNNGFKESFPLNGWEILNILGFKPFTEPGSCNENSALWKKVKDLIIKGILSDIKVENNYVASRPTIPFKTVFESYKTDDEAVNNKLWKHSSFDAKSFCIDFDSKKNQAEILIGAKKSINTLCSNTDYGMQSIDALLLGLQPLSTLIKVDSQTMNCFIQHFYCLLGFEEVGVSDSIKNKIKDFKKWGWFDSVNNRISENFIIPLSFCSNPKNYRILTYAGKKFYNDNSPYIILTGYLCEFFFRTAFGDECFLKLLYKKLIATIKKATNFSIENDSSGFLKFVLKNGLYLGNSNIPTNYELTLLPSYPQIIPTFKKFLARIFGQEGVSWKWDSDNGQPLVFIEEKKDEMIVSFFEYVEDGLSLQLNNLKNNLSELSKKLQLLNKNLEALKVSLGLAT